MKKLLSTLLAGCLSLIGASAAVGPGSGTNRLYISYTAANNANWIELAADNALGQARISSGLAGATKPLRPLVLSGNGTTLMLIVNTNGNVGIWTNNPAARLHVHGSGIIDSNLTVKKDIVAVGTIGAATNYFTESLVGDAGASAILAGGLWVSGGYIIASNIQANYLTATNRVSSASNYVSGGMVVGGVATLSSDANIGGAANVTGDITTYANGSVLGTLGVGDTATFSNDVNVAGTISGNGSGLTNVSGATGAYIPIDQGFGTNTTLLDGTNVGEFTVTSTSPAPGEVELQNTNKTYSVTITVPEDLNTNSTLTLALSPAPSDGAAIVYNASGGYYTNGPSVAAGSTNLDYLWINNAMMLAVSNTAAITDDTNVLADFNAGTVQLLVAATNLNFLASTNREDGLGKSLTFLIDANGYPRSLSFNSNWKWMGKAPETLNVGNFGVLSLLSFGESDAPGETNVYAAYNATDATNIHTLDAWIENSTITNSDIVGATRLDFHTNIQATTTIDMDVPYATLTVDSNITFVGVSNPEASVVKSAVRMIQVSGGDRTIAVPNGWYSSDWTNHSWVITNSGPVQLGILTVMTYGTAATNVAFKAFSQGP